MTPNWLNRNLIDMFLVMGMVFSVTAFVWIGELVYHFGSTTEVKVTTGFYTLNGIQAYHVNMGIMWVFIFLAGGRLMWRAHKNG